MESATLSSSNRAFHDPLGFAQRSNSSNRKALFETARASIGRRRKHSPIHSDHAGNRITLVNGHLIQDRFAEVQAFRGKIGLGFACIHSRQKGSRFLTQSRCFGECASLLSLGFSEKADLHAFLLGFSNKSNARACHLSLLEKQRRSIPAYSQFLCYGQFTNSLKKRISTAAPASLARFGIWGAPTSAEGGDASCTSKKLVCTHITGYGYLHQWLKSSSRIMSAACRGRSGDFTADEFGPYPWDPLWHAADNEGIEWVQEDIVTLFTTDGLVQIGGSLVPHQSSATERKRGKAPIRYRRFREEDYMDPKQGLCLGAIFDIVATNGLDTGRRLCVFGFCRSIEMLSDVVEDTVLEQGGEVVVAAKGNWGGLNEKLSMRVAVPLLWGVPPAVDTLNYAIRCGGGIVEKVSCQWEFL
eukprot:c21668_g1_i1 orf=266-1507(-)